MNVNEVIKYPILSEKTYAQMSEGVYTFAVDPRTNRAEVKKTVEFIFDVKVRKVNIIKIEKQPTKLGRSEGFTNRVKKAIVYLSDGVINIFPDEATASDEASYDSKDSSKAKEDKKVESTQKTEMSEAEKKAAAKIAAKASEKEAKVEAEVKANHQKKLKQNK